MECAPASGQNQTGFLTVCRACCSSNCAGLRCPAPLTYLHAYDNVGEARASLGRYFMFHNGRRPHSSLDAQTPERAHYNQMLLREAAAPAYNEPNRQRLHLKILKRCRDQAGYLSASPASRWPS
jgi:hypothetical protein